MKQQCIRYGKLIAIYLLTCLLCSLIFSVFYYFRIINSAIYTWGNFICSILISLLLTMYLIKTTEKKALLSVVIFLALLWLLSFCLMPFLPVSFVSMSIRSGAILLFAFLILSRK